MMKEILNEIVSLTRDLIRFKTLGHDHAQLDACTRFIESYLQDAGVVYTRHDVRKVPSVVVVPDTVSFPVLLMSHIDVVPAPDALFEPRMEEARLYGRGSVDDKYAVALSLVLLKHRLAAVRKTGGGQGDLNFGILITGDEESGGYNGAAKLLKDIHPDFSIALDGGSPNEIITREKGILRIELESHGKTCHASRPWMGSNAIENLFKDYAVIAAYFQKKDEANWHRTLNPAVVEGGQAVNQVPDYCRMVFDIRYTEKDDVDALVSDMKSRVRGTLTVQAKEPVFATKSSPYLETLLALDDAVATGFEHGASDARHLMTYGLTGVVWGAQGNLSHHSSDEHVEIDSIQLLYQRLDRFLQAIQSS